MEHRDSVFTAHKPPLPLFNKAKATMPPRIEKWVMEMQDVDYELVYEPGKDETDPLDYTYSGTHYLKQEMSEPKRPSDGP